jgi:hypothetical protein
MEHIDVHECLLDNLTYYVQHPDQEPAIFDESCLHTMVEKLLSSNIT